MDSKLPTKLKLTYSTIYSIGIVNVGVGWFENDYVQVCRYKRQLVVYLNYVFQERHYIAVVTLLLSADLEAFYLNVYTYY